jgi:hypothetical protein
MISSLVFVERRDKIVREIPSNGIWSRVSAYPLPYGENRLLQLRLGKLRENLSFPALQSCGVRNNRSNALWTLRPGSSYSNLWIMRSSLDGSSILPINQLWCSPILRHHTTLLAGKKPLRNFEAISKSLSLEEYYKNPLFDKVEEQ